MNADSIFFIGSLHSICQDYVLSKNDPQPFVILSDGCSSSTHADFGSRLIVKAADRFLRTVDNDVRSVHRESARLALQWSKQIGLEVEAVDATLLTAHLLDDVLTVGCSGDGVVAWESVDGTVDVHAISFPSNYPLYPTYQFQCDRFDELLAHHQIEAEVKHYRRTSQDTQFQFIDSTTSDSLTHVWQLKSSDYRYVALLSDGLNSFVRSRSASNGNRVEPILIEEVLDNLWAFKNSHGAFVARRMTRFKKDCESLGWHHADDLAIAAIHLGE